jgi:DNA invertase Pin-like site-specific DNA recombinase
MYPARAAWAAFAPLHHLPLTRLDRLARSSRDLHNILHELKEQGCEFVSLGESWCDTRSDVGRLIMTIMGGIAEFERGLIRSRCEEGIAKASRDNRRPQRPKGSDTGSANSDTKPENYSSSVNPTRNVTW